MTIVEIENLSKAYGATEVLKRVSLTIGGSGQIVGILGPNGVGKTTLVEIIEGLRTAGAGRVTVLGLDPGSQAARLRERIGVQLQSTVLPPELTPRETLRLFGAFYARARPPGELLDTVGLAGVGNVPNGRLSMGQQRRLAVALALVNDPELVILDEPTSGLDPVARREVHTHLAALRAAGRTVLLASHDLEEVERLCDRVILLRAGEIVADGTPAELASGTGTLPVLRIAVEGAFDDGPLLRAGAMAQGMEGSHRRYVTPDPNAAMVAIGRIVEGGGVKLVGLDLRRPSLEAFYVEVMGREPHPGREATS